MSRVVSINPEANPVVIVTGVPGALEVQPYRNIDQYYDPVTDFYVLPPETHWSAVTGPEITSYWGSVWPLIELAVRRTRGRHDEQSVYQSVCAKDFQVWLAGNSVVPVQLALVTEIVYYPKARWCRIIFCGGSDVEQYTSFLEQLEDWAKRSGCVGVEVVGRLGWARRLPAAYRSISQVYQKEFS